MVFYAVQTKVGWADMQGGDSFTFDPQCCLTPSRDQAERIASDRQDAQVVPVTIELGEPYAVQRESVLPELHLIS